MTNLILVIVLLALSIAPKIVFVKAYATVKRLLMRFSTKSARDG